MNTNARPSADDLPAAMRSKAIFGRASGWLWLSIAAALLAAAGSVIALTSAPIYAGLTPVFLPQALAQDVANLAVAAPAMIITAILALRGSLRAYLLWLGVVTFTVYNYVIYAFSIPFGPLFLLWVAVLGMCIYALIGGLAAADHRAVAARYTSRRAATVAAWFLIVVAIFFGFLWLSEDVPALLAGVKPQSVIDVGAPTNPIHVLDLAFFLPAAIATGVMLLRRRPFAHTAAPAMIVFLILTGVPILITPVVQIVRGLAPDWRVVGPIGALTLILLGLLIWLLSTIRAHPELR